MTEKSNDAPEQKKGDENFRRAMAQVFVESMMKSTLEQNLDPGFLGIELMAHGQALITGFSVDEMRTQIEKAIGMGAIKAKVAPVGMA